MTFRHKLCLRLLLFVAKQLGSEDWRTEIDKLSADVDSYKMGAL